MKSTLAASCRACLLCGSFCDLNDLKSRESYFSVAEGDRGFVITILLSPGQHSQGVDQGTFLLEPGSYQNLATIGCYCIVVSLELPCFVYSDLGSAQLKNHS